MKNQCLSFMTELMTKLLLLNLIIYISALFIHSQNLYSQAVYIDSNIGDDNNDGSEESPLYSIHKAAEMIQNGDNDIYTMKINPGIYVLENPVSVSTDKDMTDKRIVIEASLLPGDPSWAPEKMPVIISISKKGKVPGQDYHFVVSFLIDESQVTIRGIKFPGYFYPNTRYFPIARFNKSKSDLLVEQCLFVGDEDASHLQVGIIAHGNHIRADHCVFYNVRNSVVYWENAGDGMKTGNGITNSIIFGATQSGVWTAGSDKDFLFENNIVSDCKYAWIKNNDNPTVYSIDSCIIVNNQYYQGIAGNTVFPDEFEIEENHVIKEGTISLRQKSETTHYPLPDDYLHVLPNTLGYEMGAGLFKDKTTEINQGALTEPDKYTLMQNYPNPFNQATEIHYKLNKPSYAKLIIYNLLGEEVHTLYGSFQRTGKYIVTWNGTNNNNNPVTSGVYLYRLETSSEQILQKKMIILR